MQNLKRKSLVLLAFSLIPSVALAQSMPWEGPLRQIITSLQGPTAQLLITIAIIIAGLTFAFGEAGGMFRRIAAIVAGGAMAISATTFASSFFGF